MRYLWHSPSNGISLRNKKCLLFALFLRHLEKYTYNSHNTRGRRGKVGDVRALLVIEGQGNNIIYWIVYHWYLCYN